MAPTQGVDSTPAACCLPMCSLARAGVGSKLAWVGGVAASSGAFSAEGHRLQG